MKSVEPRGSVGSNPTRSATQALPYGEAFFISLLYCRRFFPSIPFFQGIVHPDKEAKALSLQLASPCRNCSASENRFAVPDS